MEQNPSFLHQRVNTFLSLLLIFALGFLFYIFFNNKLFEILALQEQTYSSTPQVKIRPKVSPAFDETINWKTYKDGVIFKYPGTWIEGKKEIFGSRSEQLFRSPNGNYSLIIIIQGNYNNLNGKPFPSLVEFASYNPDLKEYTTIILDAQTAHKVNTYFFDNSGNGGWKHEIYVFSKDTKFIYRLLLSTSQDTNIAENGNQIFDQILSTFKFLPDSTASSSLK